MLPKSDLELWMSLKSGDQSSFEQIYDQFFDSMYEYGIRLCKDDFILKDKIQDVFIRIWTRREQLATTSNIKAYLFSSLRNALREQFRTVELHERLLKAAMSEETQSFSLEFQLIQREGEEERLKKLHMALSQLSARQKEIIYLRFLQDMDYDELSAIMGITTKAAYKLSARALDNLKAILSVGDKELLSLLLLLNITVLRR
jgi:RNA polymerase sigma factor (sigma-70 family)